MSKQNSASMPKDDDVFEEFMRAATQAGSIAELVSVAANQGRIDRVSKASEKKARHQLAKAYAILRIAKAQGKTDELAAQTELETRRSAQASIRPPRQPDELTSATKAR